jgi:NADP-dependent 3-hydroxy acid dehydrogenase YdfG
MQDKVIVITGATGALGKLTARRLPRRHSSLALLDNDQGKLDSLVEDLKLPEERLFASVVDLRDGDAVRDSAEAVSEIRVEGIHALIHLVGGWVGGKTLSETPSKIWKTCSVSTCGRPSTCSGLTLPNSPKADGDA